MEVVALDRFSDLMTVENAIALLTLTALEVVLGIDNIVVISILTGRLPEDQRPKARRLGLGLAMGLRILLLLTITWIMRLQTDLFTVWGQGISGKDLILIAGGLFLMAKATHEIHGKLETHDTVSGARAAVYTMRAAITQILVMDLIFSLDSVITAVGMAKEIAVMIAAVIIAVAIMMIFANPVANFVERHPTVKMLALAFLILIGLMLVLDGCGQHVNKGYIYFAMFFSLAVEMLNLRVHKLRERAAQQRHQP
jgi:predicted tellurium resistance membrane protein TerC